MPNYLRGQLRDQLRFVKINPIFLYGFKTKDLAAATGISEADLIAQLGHMDAAAAAAVANRIMVTGANSPKPARVVKRDATAPISQPSSTSSFVAYDKLGAAAAGGWSLAQRSRGVKLSGDIDGKRSLTAIAELSNGLKYCFPMNRADFAVHAAALGLVSGATITTTAERNKLASGTRTKPGRCSRPETIGVFSSYYAADAADGLIAAGYNIDSTEFIEHAAAAVAP